MRQTLLFAAVVLMLLAAWWLADMERVRARAPEGSAVASAMAPAEHAELVRPSVAGSTRAPLAEARVIRPAPSAGQTSGSVGSALIRGRLRIAGTEEMLDEVLEVRLRAGDLSVKESVMSAADGSFTSRYLYPSGFVLAEVRRPAGDAAVDHEGYFDPSSNDEWVVPVPWPTFARGRLLDRSAQPLGRVRLELLHEGRPIEVKERVKRDGEFVLQDLSPGPYELHVLRGFEHARTTFTVVRGPNELGDLELPFGRGGEISGRLKSALDDPGAVLALTDLNSGATATVGLTSGKLVTFAFTDVPVGAYRLSIIPLDGRRYEPKTLQVAPSVTNILFEDVGPGERFGIQARGEQEQLDPLTLALVRSRWMWMATSFLREDVERWIALADGYRPAAGETPPAGDVEVKLERGYGMAFVFVELGTVDPLSEMNEIPDHLIAGVEVRADGENVGRSDDKGLALVSLADDPDELEFVSTGRTVTSMKRDDYVTVVRMTPER